MIRNARCAATGEKLTLSGQYFKEARQKQNISCEQVATRMTALGFDYQRSMIYRIETGERIVSFDEAIALCEILKLDLNEIGQTILKQIKDNCSHAEIKKAE